MLLGLRCSHVRPPRRVASFWWPMAASCLALCAATVEVLSTLNPKKLDRMTGCSRIGLPWVNPFI